MARLYINADMQSLPRLAPVADAFEIDGLALSLTHLGRGRSDVDDVHARLKPAGHAPASDPMRFTLYNLLLSDGQLETRAGGRPPDLSAALLHPRLPPGRRWRSGTTSLPGVFCPAGSSWTRQKTRLQTPNGHRAPNLIWRCRKNSENSRIALFLKLGSGSLAFALRLLFFTPVPPCAC